MIDATLMLTKDGLAWVEAHWIEKSSLDDPPERYNIIDIKDGTGEIPPILCEMVADRPCF